jgi:hypothetical protein
MMMNALVRLKQYEIAMLVGLAPLTVVSACGGDTEAMISICHRSPDSSHGAVVIEIPESALEEHMAHGDSPAPCGALVRVSVKSTVGVLLDELPASLRDRAAQSLQAREPAYWHGRIEDPLRLTLNQFTYRSDYHRDRPVPVGPLWLPPRAVWNITLDSAGPRRATIDGHDLVVIDYTMRSALLSDEASTCSAEPALCAIGGVWEESFVLPVDPDPQLMIARIRHACICEEGSPINSIFGPTSWSRYDQYSPPCTGADFPCPCHISEPTSLSCFDALEQHIGSVAIDVRFERVPWDDDLAGASRHGQLRDTPELLAVAANLERTWLSYRYIAQDSCEIIESCVDRPGWRRLLNFSANAVNIGRAPLHIGRLVPGNPYFDHNTFHYSECHAHLHFNHYADYRFGDSLGHKQGFCLLGTSRFTNTEHTPLDHPYNDCNNQGIPPGWGDEYRAGLSCQWVDVTDLDFSAGAVSDTLVFELNPQDFLCEGDLVVDEDDVLVFEVPVDDNDECLYRSLTGACEGRPMCEFAAAYDSNNRIETTVTIPVEGSMVTMPCTHGQLGPHRDCGFTRQGELRACAPGQPVNLACRLSGAGSGAAAEPQALRVCEASAVLGHGIACESLQALSNDVIATELGQISVSFTCPARRDDFEPGGQYAMYVAPLLPEDPVATVDCTPL